MHNERKRQNEKFHSKCDDGDDKNGYDDDKGCLFCCRCLHSLIHSLERWAFLWILFLNRLKCMARANNTNDNHNEMIITQIINNNFKGERGSEGEEERGEAEKSVELKSDFVFSPFRIYFYFQIQSTTTDAINTKSFDNTCSRRIYSLDCVNLWQFTKHKNREVHSRLFFNQNTEEINRTKSAFPEELKKSANCRLLKCVHTRLQVTRIHDAANCHSEV